MHDRTYAKWQGFLDTKNAKTETMLLFEDWLGSVLLRRKNANIEQDISRFDSEAWLQGEDDSEEDSKDSSDTEDDC